MREGKKKKKGGGMKAVIMNILSVSVHINLNIITKLEASNDFAICDGIFLTATIFHVLQSKEFEHF
jgi:hypothetical protein